MHLLRNMNLYLGYILIAINVAINVEFVITYG